MISRQARRSGDLPLPGGGAGQLWPGRNPPALSCRHGPRVGSFDETARRASHSELAVALLLAEEGHDVRTVAELRGRRNPDLLACGTPVEVKAFESLERRAGRVPTAKHVANKLLDARGQGALAVVWGLESGLTQAAARSGYRLFRERAAEQGLGLLRSARIVGKGFDLSFSLVEDLRLSCQRRPRPVAGPRPPSA